MKTYTEEEVKQFIKDTMSCTVRGMMNFFQSDSVFIVDKTTKQRIDNCEISGDKSKKPAEFIYPLLAEKGINFEINP